jgi:hypothetical protein
MNTMNSTRTCIVAIVLACPASLAVAEEAAPAAPAPAAQAAVAAAPGEHGATGTVVFFREKKFAGSAIRYKVREGNVELCKLASGTYCIVTAPVGKHEYTVHSEAKDVLTLEVESGDTYYLIGGISMGVFAGHPHLTPSDQATFEGMKAKLSDNTGKDLDASRK